MVKYLLLGLGGVAVIVFGVYYLQSRTTPTVMGADGRVVQVAALMNAAENTCLSGKKLSGTASIDAAAAVDKLSGKGSATTQVEDLKGAVDVVNESLKLQENDDIRQCMQTYTNQIFALITGKAVDDSTARQLDIRFSMIFTEPNNPVYDSAAIFIGEKFRSAQLKYLMPDPRLAVPPDSVYDWPNVLMPSKQRPYSAVLHRVVRDGYRESSKGTEICLVDGKAPPGGADLFAVLDCNESLGQCKLKERDDPGWVSFCAPQKSASLSWPGLISAAYAEETPTKVWNVPSLETLRGRKDLRGAGFTEFHIKAPSLPGEKIDSVVLDLKVNGTPVRIDGVDPEYRVLPYIAARGLDVEFALQNLDFAGINSGCDVIEAKLQPVADGRISGAPIALRRSYVALRNAEPVKVETAGREFTWTGSYIRPDNAYDYEVLVNSAQLSDLQSKPQLDNARLRVNTAKQQVDRMNLTFRGMRVVGVVRPPLTTPSFGTALGIVAPTGQIQFTFDRATAAEFKASVVAEAQHVPNGSKVVRGDTFVYPLNKNVDAPAGICLPS